MAKIRLLNRVPAPIRTIVMLALGAVLVIAFRTTVQVTVVNGHSMDPTYHTGDLLVSAKANTYRVGDVITYHPSIITSCQMCNVVHRIVSGNARTGWVTQGDNNPNQDGWLVKSNEIAGHVILHVSVPAFLRITYLPTFWLFLVLAAVACWLYLRAQEVLEESDDDEDAPPATDTTTGPRHRAITIVYPRAKHRLTN